MASIYLDAIRSGGMEHVLPGIILTPYFNPWHLVSPNSEPIVRL